MGLRVSLPLIHQDYIGEIVMGNMQNVVYGRPLPIVATVEAWPILPGRKKKVEKEGADLGFAAMAQCGRM